MTEHSIGRRHLVTTGVAALGGIAAGAAAGYAAADGPAPAPGPEPAIYPFYAAHQAGIETAAPRHAVFVGVDLLGDRVDREALRRLLLLLTDDAARLTQGVAALADTEPELAAHPAGLTVTFGFGPRVTQALGGPARAVGLRPLPAFEIDRLRPAWEQTDLLVQLRCQDPMTLAHALRVLTKDTAELGRIRWTQPGFLGPPVTDAGTGRNLMGQVDGTVNPVRGSADFAQVVWRADPGLVGATTMVLRRIRMQLDRWDKVDRIGRELTIGRRLADGSPLTGSGELDVPDLEAVDQHGFPVIDGAAHVRRAHFHRPEERFFRSPYNYLDAGESGLLFVSYQADIERQFLPVQRRLAKSDRLNLWTVPIGSAVYLIPPGIAAGEYAGQALVEA